MDKQLKKCLDDERSIFEVFNSNEKFERFQAFFSPDLQAVAHWNSVYPLLDSYEFPNAKEINQLLHFYHTKKIKGHLITTSVQMASCAEEESEYFCLNKKVLNNYPWNTEDITQSEEGIGEFCRVVQKCFSFSDSATEYFKEKMLALSQRPHSRFYIISKPMQVIGCCSTFRTISGSDFIFNVGTMPGFEGQGVASSVIASAAKDSARPLYTYSHNASMRKTILPKLGFESIGTIYCIPLAKILNEKNP